MFVFPSVTKLHCCIVNSSSTMCKKVAKRDQIMVKINFVPKGLKTEYFDVSQRVILNTCGCALCGQDAERTFTLGDDFVITCRACYLKVRYRAQGDLVTLEDAVKVYDTGRWRPLYFVRSIQVRPYVIFQSELNDLEYKVNLDSEGRVLRGLGLGTTFRLKPEDLDNLEALIKGEKIKSTMQFIYDEILEML